MIGIVAHTGHLGGGARAGDGSSLYCCLIVWGIDRKISHRGRICLKKIELRHICHGDQTTGGLFCLVIKLHASPGCSDMVFNSGVCILILVCHQSFSFVKTEAKASVKASAFCCSFCYVHRY